MHETGIVESVIERASVAAGGRPIRQVHVALGQLSDISPESLAFYFDQLRPGTAVATATLVIRPEPGRVRCHDCAQESVVETETANCPVCGSARIYIVAGWGLALEAIDVE